MIRKKFANTFIDCLSLQDVIDEVALRVEKKIKTHIVFLNALKISEIEKNSKIKKGMHEAEMILADGIPIVWLSKLFGYTLPGRVNGTDLFEKLLNYANENEKRIFLLGTTEQNLKKLVDILHNKHPKMIINSRNGYYNDDEDEEVLEKINQSNSDILFIGFSSPKKEVWVNKYKRQINVPIIQGVGGSFDVLAGLIPRAPRWMQENGLEWLFRVLMEPRRMFKRYLVSNLQFIYIVFKYFLKSKMS